MHLTDEELNKIAAAVLDKLVDRLKPVPYDRMVIGAHKGPGQYVGPTIGGGYQVPPHQAYPHSAGLAAQGASSGVVKRD